MSKRANGEGSVRAKPRGDGRWEARYTVESAGQLNRLSIFGKTRQEAAQKLRAALAGRDGGAKPVPAKETVGTYLTSWLAGAEPALRPRTRDSYLQIVRSHLIPLLGSIPLGRLGPQQLQQAYRDLSERGLSPKTIANVHGVLHKALDQAFRWRLLPANVADLVDPPRIPRREMKSLTPDEARQVLLTAEGDPLEPLYRLAITAGLRQGELLALRWPDVDLERGTVSVVATLEQRRGHEAVVAQPKTSRSRRQVQLGAAAVDALRRQRSASPSIGFVFARADGKPLSMSIIGKAWTRLNGRAGVPRVRFHDLRHTAATLMLSRGVHPKIVSEMLGHATVAITLDVYSHVMPTMQLEAARLMDDLLSQ